MIATRKRSIVKTISWRILATFDTIILVFIFTGDFTVSITVGSVEVFTKIFLYYFHERGWGKIKWGQYRDEKSTSAQSQIN